MQSASKDPILIYGTRQFYGVGGCMCDELAARGYAVRFVESAPRWSRSLLSRALGRALRDNAPSVLSANSRLVRASGDAALKHAIITNGRELWGSTVARVRTVLERRGGGVACYLCDDPFNPRHRSASWLSALREYSVVVSTKRRVIPDLIDLGCRSVKYGRFGYHPPVHRPTDPDAMGFAPCDIAFAGNADSDRLPILGALARRLGGPRLQIYGHGWDRDPDLRVLAKPPVLGIVYSAAMRAAKVCPCLVRHANRDGHVMRSIELPAIGAFMLAERTDEHQEMFDAGVHCEYWSTPEELADKSLWYLSNPRRAATIACAGHSLVTTNPYSYADRALQVIEMIATA